MAESTAIEIAQTSQNLEQGEPQTRIHFMQSNDQAEKVAAMQLKYNIKPLDAEQQVKPRSTVDQGKVENPTQVQDRKDLLTYFAFLNLEQKSDVPLDVAVHAFLSHQATAAAELDSEVSEVNDSSPETEPLGDPATNGLGDADSTAVQSETVESVAPSADLELEPKSLDLAATEHTTATDYELLDDSQELPTEADELLVDDEIPFSDELESGPPFQEEDDSFFDPEEDSSDSLLEEDLEPSESVLPSDLNERVEAYLKSHGISAEPEHESNSHSFAPAISHSSSGAEFGE